MEEIAVKAWQYQRVLKKFEYDVQSLSSQREEKQSHDGVSIESIE
jgi:hypothetical protein